MSDTGCTIYFDYSIARFPTNPFKADTIFGLPKTIGKGNAFQRLDALELALADACDRLERAGVPATDLEALLEGGNV